MNGYSAMNKNAKKMMHRELEGYGEEQTDFFNNLLIPWLNRYATEWGNVCTHHVFLSFLSVNTAMF
jgi:TorA maturation chaperone TorD